MGYYCIETKKGKLEVSKGAYLTMLKRKTPQNKRKFISRNHPTSTLKKMKTFEVNRKSKSRSIKMRDRFNKCHTFNLPADYEVFEGRMILPSISMEYDNDNESSWNEI